ncbi:unnamed protein product [Linum tenue]|uniref:Uncharacterized protein n=1 Tax=Linum tenue TaxID=586396 RepID=A0AAV0NDJ6_9ROSI|nr:unnamed protein product [Linum tenue]
MHAVQRLGVGYHFEAEIEEALEKVHDMGEDLFTNFDGRGTDLYHAALRFRLLRQQGFPVSLDGFRKLKNSEGRFKEWLSRDEQGLLSLYEAAHIAFHAWKCVPRSLARHSLDFYSDQGALLQNQKLLTFAKLDFNMVQSIHKQELRELSEWWKSIDGATNFPYARDRLVECYFWILCIYFEPEYSVARVLNAKIYIVLTTLNDTCDNFGTYEEVQALVKAIERLDARALDELPDRMKNMYRLTLNVYDEIEEEAGKKGSTFIVEYAKEEYKKLARAYLKKNGWCTEGQVPTVEEYLIESGYVTGGMPIVCGSAFVGMRADIVTREDFEWANNESKMFRSGSAICRIQNDIFTYKFEEKRNHAPSSVQCCMKQYGISDKEAVEFLLNELSNSWKNIAREYCQKPTLLPTVFKDRVINYARSMNLFYDNRNGDRYTNSHLLKEHLTALFIDPVPL